MNEWSHLPNAKLIDQVLAERKAHPEEFAAAWSAAWSAARSEARSAARSEARSEAWLAAGDVAWSAAWSAAWDVAGDVARSAVAALIAWDHSAKYLHMSYEELKVWYHLSEDPAALLLLPYVRARELIAEKDVAKNPHTKVLVDIN